MGRAFWLGQLGVIACLGLGLAWPPMFVAAAVLQGVVVLRAVMRSMRALAAYEANPATPADSAPPDDPPA